MPTKPPDHHHAGWKPREAWRHSEKRKREQNQRYGSRWRRRRNAWLADNPLCAACLAETPPRITPGDVVDHVTGVDDPDSPLMTLCLPHHHAKTSAEGRAAQQGKPRPTTIPKLRIKGCRADGTPIDPRHPWNKG